MADDRVEVTFGAKIDELVSGMQDMSSAVQDQLGKMIDSMKEMSDQSKKTADDVKAYNDQAAASFKDLQEGISGSLDAVRGGISKFIGLAGTVGAVLGAAGLTKSTVEWADEVGRLSSRLGISAEKASGLAMSLRILGMSTDEYLSLVQRLERQVKQNAKVMENLGIVLKDRVTGNAKDLADVMEDCRARIAEYAAGGNQAQIAMALMGGRVADLSKFLRLTKEMMEEGAKAARDFNMVLDPQAVQAAHKYEEQVNKTKEAVSSLGRLVGSDLMPPLERVATWMTTKGVGALKEFAKGFDSVRGAITNFIAVLPPAALLRLLPQAQGKLSGGGRFGVLPPPPQQTEASGSSTPPGKQTATTDIANAQAAASKGAAAGAQDIMAQFEAALEKLKNSQSDLNAWSSEKDYQFWNQKLAAAKQGSAQWQEIWNKMADIYRSMCAEQQRTAEKSAQDQIQTAKLVADMQKSDAETAIKVQQEKLNSLVALDQISASQRATAEMALYDKEFTAALTAQYKELALIQQTGDASIAKQAEVYDRIEKLQNQHILKMQQTEDQYLAAEKKQWDGYVSQVGNALTSLLFHHSTMLQTMQQLTERAIGKLIDLGLEEAEHWILNELRKTLATQMGAAARASAEAAGADASILAQAGAILKSIMASAGETFAGIFGFLSPVMGPAAAGPAAAGEATVMSVASMVSASAAQGFDVPSGLSGLMQFHPREMMLPAPLADKVRNMTEPGSGGGGGEFHNHVHVHTSDTKSFERLLKDANSPLMKQIKASFRDFHLRLR